jgi:serine/threonine protein kinase
VTIPAGTKLGRYEIRSKIGEGGMGEVYRARHESLNRDVAIKLLPAFAQALHRERGRTARSQREANVGDGLS